MMPAVSSSSISSMPASTTCDRLHHLGDAVHVRIAAARLSGPASGRLALASGCRYVGVQVEAGQRADGVGVAVPARPLGGGLRDDVLVDHLLELLHRQPSRRVRAADRAVIEGVDARLDQRDVLGRPLEGRQLAGQRQRPSRRSASGRARPSPAGPSARAAPPRWAACRSRPGRNDTGCVRRPPSSSIHSLPSRCSADDRLDHVRVRSPPAARPTSRPAGPAPPGSRRAARGSRAARRRRHSTRSRSVCSETSMPMASSTALIAASECANGADAADAADDGLDVLAAAAAHHGLEEARRLGHLPLDLLDLAVAGLHDGCCRALRPG